MQKKLKFIWFEMTQDKKRFGAMCSLLAVGLLLWARLLILQDVPKTGFAQPSDQVDELVGVADGEIPNGGHNNFDTLSVYQVEAGETLVRNIFVVSPKHFPETVKVIPDTQDPPKSESETPEDPIALEAQRVQLIHDDAAQLMLESVILGSSALAIINGQMLTVGSEINGFELLRVDERSVAVVKDGIQLELQMKMSDSGSK